MFHTINIIIRWLLYLSGLSYKMHEIEISLLFENQLIIISYILIPNNNK